MAEEHPPSPVLENVSFRTGGLRVKPAMTVNSVGFVSNVKTNTQ